MNCLDWKVAINGSLQIMFFLPSVVQNRICAMWFKGKELAFAFGCILAFSRLVSCHIVIWWLKSRENTICPWRGVLEQKKKEAPPTPNNITFHQHPHRQFYCSTFCHHVKCYSYFLLVTFFKVNLNFNLVKLFLT